MDKRIPALSSLAVFCLLLCADSSAGWELFSSQRNSGFVEVRLNRTQVDNSPVFLDNTDLKSFDNDEIFLEVPSGQSSLANAAPGWTSWGRIEYCKVNIRQNRVTSLVVTGVNHLRCQCEIKDPSGTAELPVCE
jgi:hypothetical protein